MLGLFLLVFVLSGCNDKSQWEMWKNLFHCDYFKVKCIEDEHTVELCGALKVCFLDISMTRMLNGFFCKLKMT